MYAIQAKYVHFSEIAKRDGMPVEGFKCVRIEGQNSPYRRTADQQQCRDNSLVIETQAAHDRLASVFNIIADEQKILSFRKLTISSDVKNIELDAYARICPDINHIDLPSNQTIEVSKLLQLPNLTCLRIRDSKIYWNDREKNIILNHGPRKNLEILLDNHHYQFHYPSAIFFRSGFILLNIILLLGLTNLVAIPLAKNLEGHSWTFTHCYTKKSFFPITIAFASLILQYYLYLYSQQKKKNESYEIIRETS